MRKWLLLMACVLASCSHNDKKLKVAATPHPHAEILNLIVPDLKEEGIELQVVEVDDYAIPNRLLQEKQVDANFFQHRPFLNEQKKQFGYDLEELTAVHIEPLGIYSKQVASLDQVEEGAIVAIPSDPTNEGRALDLLVQVNLIQLRCLEEGSYPTVLDIVENPKRLKIKEVDAPFLPRTLADVTLAVIPANFALQAGLNPEKDALAVEEEDSAYVNIVAIRSGDQREGLQILKQKLHSEKVSNYLEKKYKGAVIPVAGN